ncbi:MAG: cytochrome P450 [Acidimicrobiia bacterium]
MGGVGQGLDQGVHEGGVREVDLLDPTLWARAPHDVWADLRARPGLHRDERNGLWAVVRHGDVVDVERRAADFSSAQGYRVIWDPEEKSMVALDDPAHRRQRMHVQPLLSRRAVREYRDHVESIVVDLLDGIGDRDVVEVVAEIAAPLPARLTARLLGLPEDRWPDVARWSEVLMRLDVRDRDGQVFTDFYEANREIHGLLKDLAGRPGACPAGTLLDRWMGAPVEGLGAPLPPRTVLHEVGLFVAGGSETTRTAIAHGLRAFCDDPGAWESMARDPDAVPAAVEEVLRWVTPINTFFRRATVDTVVGGQPVGRGERLVLVFPAANRDERVFADPDRFDATRDPNPHLAFGIGTHRCLGEHLARLDLTILFTEMSRRFTGLVPAAEPDVEPNIFARAVRSFPLALARR